ncbi:STAS domain-containing protein [Ruminococcus sp. FC2018]|uniref:STAS domain-containing protein n=1 Tax=Ruminococcus sp. FC2018 TaxID=1410617 RepID=UPI00049153E1|nr:STAS domain-containing protein [Ruminococcus sp. FC2018]
MEIKMTKLRNKLTVELDGKLDVNSSPQLEEKLRPELKSIDNLTIDMEKLKYISSAGLRVLVASLQTLDAHGGTMTLKNVSDENMKVFKLTGLSDVFDIR